MENLRRGPKSKSSHFRGVTFYKRTSRWESHIWDQKKQIYLGSSVSAEKAARAHDRAAILFRGIKANLNFDLADYADELEKITALTKEQLVHILRTQSYKEGKDYPDYSLFQKCTVQKPSALQFEDHTGNCYQQPMEPAEQMKSLIFQRQRSAGFNVGREVEYSTEVTYRVGLEMDGNFFPKTNDGNANDLSCGDIYTSNPEESTPEAAAQASHEPSDFQDHSHCYCDREIEPETDAANQLRRGLAFFKPRARKIMDDPLAYAQFLERFSSERNSVIY